MKIKKKHEKNRFLSMFFKKNFDVETKKDCLGSPF